MYTISLPIGLLAALLLPLTTHAFSFSYTAPTSCDPLTLTWSGGTPPFTLLLTPAFSTARNISVPSSAYSTSSSFGNFSTQLEVPPNHAFLLTMSDATGFNAGGTSDVLYAGPSLTGNTQCNTTGPPNWFDFDLNPSTPVQCQSQIITWPANATQPIQVTGLIPLGEAFGISAQGIANAQSPSAETSYAWTVNVAANSSFILIATDALGHIGGTSQLLTVSSSSNSSCINSLSPSSTVNAQPSQTGTTSAPPSSGTSASASITPSASSSPSSSNPSSSHISTGGIIGASVGSAIALILLLTLFIFCCRRRRSNSSERASSYRSSPGPTPLKSSPFKRLTARLSGAPRPQTRTGLGMIDLLPNPSHASLAASAHSNTQYEPVPFVIPHADSDDPSSGAPWESRSRTASNAHTDDHHALTSPGTPGQPFFAAGRSGPKAREARMHAAPPTQFVMHQDAGTLSVSGSGPGSAGSEDGEGEAGGGEETVELPPAYGAALSGGARAGLGRGRSRSRGTPREGEAAPDRDRGTG